MSSSCRVFQETLVEFKVNLQRTQGVILWVSKRLKVYQSFSRYFDRLHGVSGIFSLDKQNSTGASRRSSEEFHGVSKAFWVLSPGISIQY